MLWILFDHFYLLSTTVYVGTIQNYQYGMTPQIKPKVIHYRYLLICCFTYLFLIFINIKVINLVVQGNIPRNWFWLLLFFVKGSFVQGEIFSCSLEWKDTCISYIHYFSPVLSVPQRKSFQSREIIRLFGDNVLYMYHRQMYSFSNHFTGCGVSTHITVLFGF